MRKLIGTFHTDGKIRVSDPCYDTSVWCSGELDVLPGNYIAFYELEDGAWGKRVKELEINHCNNLFPFYNGRASFEVGVDSGQAGFFDAPYYESRHHEYYVDDNDEDGAWYHRVCEITLSKNVGIIDDLGVVSSSGYGDGGYDCLIARNDDGVIVGAKIVFIGELDDEDGEDDDYEEEDGEEDYY